jgi:two-component system, NtrC family, response regulator AtoC
MIARVLVVDDDQSMCELLAEGLGSRGFAVESRASGGAALALLEGTDFDVVLTDLHLEGASGLELCERILARRADVCVVVMTAFGSLEGAIGAIRAGAYDFVIKPVSMDALALTVERATQHRRLRTELKQLRERVELEELPNMVSGSPAMKQVKNLVSRIAASDASVLITGESGTGKELIAKAIHEQSGRKGPFLAINCAAVPETLLESELFGHARGAFTDARIARKGLFIEAHGGTLLLDEIGEMAPGMQAKILRALQERKVRPVGESSESPFDARIITATNRDLEAEVSARRFREDLFYRINVVRLELPPLRARGNDVLLLAQHFLARGAARSGRPVSGLGSAVAEKLLSYEWPGNVRELENCIERAVALASYDEITSDDLPPKIRDQKAMAELPVADDPTELPSMQTVEDRYIQRVLQGVKGNKTLAAKVLGFDRRTLYRKLASISSSATATNSA